MSSSFRFKHLFLSKSNDIPPYQNRLAKNWHVMVMTTTSISDINYQGRRLWGEVMVLGVDDRLNPI